MKVKVKSKLNKFIKKLNGMTLGLQTNSELSSSLKPLKKCDVSGEKICLPSNLWIILHRKNP